MNPSHARDAVTNLKVAMSVQKENASHVWKAIILTRGEVRASYAATWKAAWLDSAKLRRDVRSALMGTLKMAKNALNAEKL